MRSRGIHTYRSTGDIFDNPKSFLDIFTSQLENISLSGGGFFNDMDMLTVGMRGKGNVGMGGSSDSEYLMQFAIWAFMGSPLIIGGDVRNMDAATESILLNKNLIALNQDSAGLPPYLIGHDGDEGKLITMGRMLSGGRFAAAIFNTGSSGWQRPSILFSDIGIPVGSGISVRLTDAVTGEEIGVFNDRYQENIEPMRFRIIIGEIVK